MKEYLNTWFFWLPRVLTLLFALFLSTFALDVFGHGDGFLTTLLALLIHLVPTGIILVIAVISWRWEWVGAILFSALGFLYLISCWGRFHWTVYLVISGPLFLIGGLFLWSCLPGYRSSTKDAETGE